MNVIRYTRAQFADVTPEVGQIYLIQDNDEPAELKLWTGTEWNEIKAEGGSEITMTAYDMNKQLIHSLPELTPEEISSKREMITNFCNATDNLFYMLLCRDTNYYTLMYRERTPGLDAIADVVTECAETQGAIKSIELMDGAIEIWVSNLVDTYVMYFFPYDGGVERCR